MIDWHINPLSHPGLVENVWFESIIKPKNVAQQIIYCSKLYLCTDLLHMVAMLGLRAIYFKACSFSKPDSFQSLSIFLQTVLKYGASL